MTSNKAKLDKLNIVQWNIKGLRARSQELRAIIKEENISVACLQETLLGDASWKPNKHFKLEKSPHLGGDNRGVALLLHSSLQYTRTRLLTTLEAVAVTIHSGRKITIASLYLSPNNYISKDEIKSVIRQLPRPFLLLGDFNAKHPLWDHSNPADQRGRLVEALIMEESLGIFNEGLNTHYHIQTNSFSAIDLSLCSVDATGLFTHKTSSDLRGSNHFPL